VGDGKNLTKEEKMAYAEYLAFRADRSVIRRQRDVLAYIVR
jgi:hypothetical protein